MNYVIFDLEWNRVIKAVKKRCPDEIIQIGAVKYNSELKCIETFNRFIKPVLYKKIESTISGLTGLTMPDLHKNGVLFSKAIKDFKKFVGTDSILMSWGTQDASILRTNCHYFNSDAKLVFLENYADVQRYVTHTLVENNPAGNQISVKMAADLTGIEYDENKLHDALFDATISGKVFAKLFNSEKLKKYIVDASSKNCDFKDTPVTDIKNKQIDKTVFKIRCPICGRYTRKKQGWFLSGNKFVSTHICRKCKRKYMCSVEVLKTYGNILKYKKRIKYLDADATKKRS